MKNTFNTAFALVVNSEGGFTDNPKDRGNWTTGVIGRGICKGTKYGISAMAYPDLDIRNLTQTAAKAIYQRDYWSKASCDVWPAGVDYFVFDCAVNHGVARAIRFIQTALRVTPDGIVGPKTIAAAHDANPRDLLVRLGVIRDEFFDDLDNETFEDGWRKRAFEVTFNAYDIALGRL